MTCVPTSIVFIFTASASLNFTKNIFSKNKNFNSLGYNILYVLDFHNINWCSKTCARDETMSFTPVMFICAYTYALKICWNTAIINFWILTISPLIISFLQLKINLKAIIQMARGSDMQSMTVVWRQQEAMYQAMHTAVENKTKGTLVHNAA